MNYCEKNCKESDEFTRGMSHQTKSKYINNRTINLINKHYEEMNNHKDVINEQQIEILKHEESRSIYNKIIHNIYELLEEHHRSVLYYESIYDWGKIQKYDDEIQKYEDEIQNLENKIGDIEDVCEKHHDEIQNHLDNVKSHIDECLLYNKDSLNNNLRAWMNEYNELENEFNKQRDINSKKLYTECEKSFKFENDIKELFKIDEKIETKEIDENFKNINQKFKEMDEKIIKLTNTLEINMKIFETLISYLENNDSKCKK